MTRQEMVALEGQLEECLAKLSASIAPYMGPEKQYLKFHTEALLSILTHLIKQNRKK